MALDAATIWRFFREYWDWDPKISNARDQFGPLMIRARFALGKKYQDIFSQVIAGFGQFTLESPEMFIGQASYTGVAISDRYMLIIPDSLIEWLHIFKRPLCHHFTDLHWSPIGADTIGYDQICQRWS
jgi:hypothetical protein